MLYERGIACHSRPIANVEMMRPDVVSSRAIILAAVAEFPSIGRNSLVGHTAVATSADAGRSHVSTRKVNAMNVPRHGRQVPIMSRR